MKNVFLYAHGGSGNHGCEAIVRSTLGILQCKDRSNCTLISKVPEEDAKYGIDQLCTIIQEQEPYSRLTLDFAKAYLHLKIMFCWTSCITKKLLIISAPEILHFPLAEIITAMPM